MNIEYRLDGPESGPLVVLSNSLGTTLDMWHPQIAALSEHFRVLRYNTRGHGATPLPAEDLTLEVLGADVIRLLDHLKIDSAHFCGISMGGLTGLWLARYQPDRIKKLVVANSAARIGSAENWTQRAQEVRTNGLTDVAAASSARWFTKAYIREGHPVVSRLVMQLSHANPTGYAACCDALANADLRDEVAHIKTPTLVVAGEFDEVTTLADAEWLQRHIPRAQLAILPASHLSNLACPENFNQTISRILLS